MPNLSIKGRQVGHHSFMEYINVQWKEFFQTIIKQIMLSSDLGLLEASATANDLSHRRHNEVPSQCAPA